MAGSNRLPLLVLGGVVVAIAAATLVIRSRADAPPEPSTPVVGAEAESPADPLAPGAVPAAGRRPATDPERRVEAVAARREDLRARHAARTEEMREQAEKTFASERADPQWSAGKQRELDAITDQPAFAAIGVEPKRLDIECRSSMCRIEGDFASPGQADDWVLVYMSSVGSTLPNSVVTRVPNPDGSSSVRIYGRAR